MKIRLACAVVVAAIGLTTGTAAADPPTRTDPLGNYQIYIPSALTPCGDFVGQVADKERLTTFAGDHGAVAAVLTGSLKMTLTSVVSGRSIDLSISGPLRVTPEGDWVGQGAWLLYTPEQLSFVHGLLYMPGGDALQVELTGRVVDLCEVLVG